MLGELGLPRLLAPVVLEPPQRGEKYELNVGQLVWGQRLANLALPRQRGAPEQKAGILLWCLVARARGCVSYAERSLASAISDAMVTGKSAVIIGPSCWVCSRGPSISAAYVIRRHPASSASRR